tara:strand:- start:7143 stop:8315 length:1173 start_codon:yes stop_codon:yes gene_type:complete
MEITALQFENFCKPLKEPKWFKSYRKSYFNKIKSSLMPNPKYGLTIKLDPKFDFNIAPKPETHLPKITYDKNSNVKIYSGNAMPDTKDVKPFLSKEWEENNKVFNFNQAFINDIILIHIPKSTKLKKPIQIDYNLKDSPTISLVCILAESNSEAQILLSKHSNKNNQSYIADDIRIITFPNSKIDFVTIQNISKDAINFQRRNAISKKDSIVNWIDVCLGTKYTKSDVISNLIEEGATSNNKVLFFGSSDQQFDVYTASIHKSPNTYSDIITKGVLNENSKALSRGLVKIEKNASGSNGYETQDVLLLSEQAEADAIPNLEILNNDVKCSHGSTVGQIDKDKLFYLMSRGLSEKDAKEKIVEGYFTPILDLFSDNTLKEKIHKSLTEAMQ